MKGTSAGGTPDRIAPISRLKPLSPIEEKAIDVLKKKGPMTAGYLGCELRWNEHCNPYGGSHSGNRFCRAAGKLLAALERRRLVVNHWDGPLKLWHATA